VLFSFVLNLLIAPFSSTRESCKRRASVFIIGTMYTHVPLASAAVQDGHPSPVSKCHFGCLREQELL
jgi:hypothetical protein